MIAKHRIFCINDKDGIPTGWLKTEGKKYQSNLNMLKDVDEFLTELTPEFVISVNCMDSEHHFLYSVIVWYWSET